MRKKTLKTSKEIKSGKNIKSIDLKTLTEKENERLIEKAKKGSLDGYHVVNPGKKDEYLRSDPDRKKKNNLDPIIKKKARR